MSAFSVSDLIRCTSVCGLAAVSMLCATPVMALPLDGIYATGVDATSTPLVDGAVDPHWEVSNDGGQTFVPALNEKNNYCGSCGGIWIEWPEGDSSTSRGITHPSFVRASAANNVFIWRQSFDVPADADPASITLSYSVGYDDVSRNAADDGDLAGCNHTVWLNGTAYAMTATGSQARTECQATIPAGSGFAAGQNTIEFRISNLATYYGFRLEDVVANYEVATVCGDGLLEGGESCDDGNMIDGDGCSASCEVEDGYTCVEPDYVFNGDFELGDTGTGGMLARDLNPALALCGAQDFIPRDNFYHVTSSPYQSCTCDGGQGLCLALNGGGVVWAQTLTGLAPNTTYTVSARHALKGESDPGSEPRLELVVDGATLASASPTVATAPIPYETITATFTTGAAQTTALVEFVNPVMVTAGNDAVLDSISVTGPSLCDPPCGDGVIDAGEACDDGNMVSGDGCSDSCVIEDAWSCAGEPSMCDLLCGNGTLDAGEACDDGNMTGGDGCSATCLDERVNLPLYSTGVNDAGTPLVEGLVDTHWEVSLDGGAFVPAINDRNNYCTSCNGGTWLEWPIGNQSTSRGITHPSVVRAPSPDSLFAWRQHFTLPMGARPDTATVTYRVGYDEFSRNAADDGNTVGCDHTVWLNGMAYAMTATGNPFRTECEATLAAGSNFLAGQNTIEFKIANGTTFYGFRLDTIEGTFLLGCGDGALQAGEGCDDGNTDDGDGCSASCAVEDGYTCNEQPSMCVLDVVEPVCGDGVIAETEDCDDGNMVDGDGCSASCEVEDGYTCNEQPSMCVLDAVASKCGDGALQAGEGCDDGNVADGDGCSATCMVEAKYECSGEPSTCTPTANEPACGDGMVQAGETCDDGNVTDGDGCSATCQKEAMEPIDDMPTVEDEGCSSTGGNAPAGGTVCLLGLLGLCGMTRRRRQRRA